ncbi:MAG: DUF456 domain-containing protein [Anaerolineaceae bacterium]
MEAIANSTWFVPVIAVIMALGLFSLLTYIVPGLTIIWIAALVYGIVKGFTVPTAIIFGVITLLMLGGNIVDNLTMGASAKKTGASWLSIAVALVAGVAGTFLLPPFGGILFAAVGILVVEWIRNKNLEAGLRSTGGILKGCGLGVILRFGIGVIMIGLWVLWVVLAR